MNKKQKKLLLAEISKTIDPQFMKYLIRMRIAELKRRVEVLS